MIIRVPEAEEVIRVGDLVAYVGEYSYERIERNQVGSVVGVLGQAVDVDFDGHTQRLPLREVSRQ